jgi:hypothetical protein
MPRSSPTVRRLKAHARIRRRFEPPHVYYVYVIEATDPRTGKRKMYVGQSGKTPEARLRDHRAKAKTYCARCAPRHYVPRGSGLRLRYDLFSEYNPISSRPRAEAVERQLARRLQGMGFTVIGGH